jgi:hypothetical protein
MKLWRGAQPPYRELGVDARWEHCLVVIDANGNIVEQWTQWDKIMRRPHHVTINPYDPDKNLWLVDDPAAPEGFRESCLIRVRMAGQTTSTH